MKYALLIYDTPNSWEAIPAEDREAVHGEYLALRADERCIDGAQLHPVETATTVQVHDGRSLTTDGPFADTKEVFGGYYVVDVADLDEALGLAARIPAARLGGKVEVRPIVEPPS